MKNLTERLTHAWPRKALDAMLELALVLERRTVEEGDCRIWQGATSADGRPRVWTGDASLPLRRVIWEAMHGTIVGDIRIGAKCGCPRCVEPAHLFISTRSRELRGLKRSPGFGAKVAAGKRANSNITPELVAIIRSSDLNNSALGREIGMNHRIVSKIRNHEIWRDYSTPFAGLGAR